MRFLGGRVETGGDGTTITTEVEGVMGKVTRLVLDPGKQGLKLEEESETQGVGKGISCLMITRLECLLTGGLEDEPRVKGVEERVGAGERDTELELHWH